MGDGTLRGLHPVMLLVSSLDRLLHQRGFLRRLFSCATQRNCVVSRSQMSA